MKIKKELIKKLFLIFLISGYLLSFSFFHSIVAEEIMPDKNELTNTITQQAQNETSQISPQGSTTASTEVVNTGDDVNVENTAQSENQTQVDNQNTADINQNVTASANTGNNEASRNISFGGDAGMITTGNASVNVEGQVNANSNATMISGDQTGAAANTEVVNTGNNLTTSTTATSTTMTMVNNNNTTTINQTVNASANTGGNIADRNISIGGNAGVITTGNASTNVNFLVTANGNVILIGGVSDGNGPGSGASIILTNTGDNSRFTTRSTTNNFIVVTNENRALISQTCGIPENELPLFVEASTCLANTGGNVANRNIGLDSDAGVITTGDAQVNVVMAANANNNLTSIFLDDPSSSNSEVVNTGDNVDIDTTSTSNTNIDVNNRNQANVNQKVNARANTGENTANRNISLGGNAGVITTGNAEVNVEMLVNVNKNVTKIKLEKAICTPTPTPGQVVVVTPTPGVAVVTPTPTKKAAEVEVTPTAVPSPTAVPAAAEVTPSPIPTEVAPTITPTGEVAAAQVPVPQLPAAGSESLILGIIDAFLILTLGLIFKRLSDSIINS